MESKLSKKSQEVIKEIVDGTLFEHPKRYPGDQQSTEGSGLHISHF